MTDVVRSSSAHTDEDERPCRLLVVDDDSGIRTLLEVSISLDPRFTLVGTASTAAETLTFLRSARDTAIADVILLDVTLPDADGIDALHAIRAVAAGAKIALFTGWSDQETIARAERAGADAIFPKDGDPRRLLDGIAALTSRTTGSRS